MFQVIDQPIETPSSICHGVTLQKKKKENFAKKGQALKKIAIYKCKKDYSNRCVSFFLQEREYEEAQRRCIGSPIQEICTLGDV